MSTDRCSFIFGDDIDHNLEYDEECDTEYCMDANAFASPTGAFNYTQMMNNNNRRSSLKRYSSNRSSLNNKC